MAGIGFRLQRIMRREDFAGMIRAYFYSGLLGSGPWIISIAALAVLTVLLGANSSGTEITYLTSTITYCYAFSLILIGPFQLVLTRYAADEFFLNRAERIFPSYMAGLCVILPLSVIGGVLFFFLGTYESSLLYKTSAVGLMCMVCGIFTAANYLTSFRNYRFVLWSFLIGFLVSCGAAYYFAQTRSVDAALAGFAAGHAVLFLLLFLSMTREFTGKEIAHWHVLRHFRRFPDLALAGLMYNLGIWIDKILFWLLSEQSFSVNGWIRASPEYDKAIYMGLLSIVPGMAVFILKLETEFARRYKELYETVLGGGTFARITEARNDIIVALRRGFFPLLQIQGLTTLILLLSADRIFGNFINGAVAMGILKIALIGCFLLVIFLALLTVLFYFDDRQGIVICTGVFLFSNALCSYLSLIANETWYGFGFVFACALALLVTALRVNHRLEHLDYYIFASQRV